MAPADLPYRVIVGDCREVMRGMADRSVDHVLADPAYDEKTHGGLMSAKKSKSKHRTTGPTNRPNMVRLDFDPLADLAGLVADQLRVAKRWVLNFCALEMIGAYRDAAGPWWVRAGFWYRPDGAPQFSGDRPAQPGDGVAIMHRKGRMRWNGGGHKAYWSVGVEHVDREHATQKPLKLLLRQVEQYTDPGDLVLDTHMGSGTTGVACIRLGRRFIGIELDADKAAIATERLAAELAGLSLSAARAGQAPLFGPDLTQHTRSKAPKRRALKQAPAVPADPVCDASAAPNPAP